MSLDPVVENSAFALSSGSKSAAERVAPRLRQTLLIVDDSPVVTALLYATMGQEIDILVANDGREALAIAVSRLPDLIILDILLPEFDGFEVCRRLKEDERTRSIPVIFLTGLNAAADETRGLQLGAIDFLSKPIEATILTLRVRNHLELKRYRDFLENLSLVDGLTGVGNRRRLDETLAREWRRARRVSGVISLALIDVDYFKRYNDRYGHAAGDQCLRRIAGILTETVRRPADLAARFGGEEFAIVMPQTTRDGAVAVAERVRRGVAALAIPHAASEAAPYVTVTAGVASVVVEEPSEDAGGDRGDQAEADGAGLLPGPETLLEQADRQLYAAKAAGRNRTA